jgi:hypothetical protein
MITVTENPIIEAHIIHLRENASEAAPANKLEMIRGIMTAGPIKMPYR